MDAIGDHGISVGSNENPIDVPNETHSGMAFSKMDAFRKRGQLCDVVIKVGGREFLAHRVVLAATSDYFDAMFSSGMAESAQLEVELKSISPDVMDALLDYVYTGRVGVSMDNVQDLLPAASLVQMEGVKSACSNFLFSEVDVTNVLGIRRFAELHNCSELEQFTRNYAAHNFDLVVDHEEFLCLTHEELLELIVREDLRIDNEESVYKAVMRWTYHRVVERSAHLPELLRNVRLPVMSVRFLTDEVDKDVLIKQSLECRDLVDDAKRFHLRPDLRHEMRERYYRQRDGGDEYLVVIGGFGSDQNPSDSVEMFNPRTREWSELPDLPISYRYVAACSLDTCVYVIGGFDGRERLNTVCLLDIAQRSEGWRWLTPMHYKRGLSAACTHKGLIYVCGGFDGESRLRSLEVYHPKIDEWRILEDMTTAREGAGLVVFDETLYCLGGYDGFHLLNCMEAFDLRSGTWSACKPMYMRRSGAGCALLGDTIYVCGGYGGAEGRGPLHLDTVEAYSTRLSQWTLVSDMNLPRCYVGACALAGKIYVAAGYNGSRLLDTLESYDPIENAWCLHEGSRMNHERCDTGMCVVRFLSYSEPPAPTTTGLDLRVISGTNPIEGASRQSTANSQRGLMGASRTQSDTQSYRIPMTGPEIRPRLSEEGATHEAVPLCPSIPTAITRNSDNVPLNGSTSTSDSLRPGLPPLVATTSGAPLPSAVTSNTAAIIASVPHLRRRPLPVQQMVRTTTTSLTASTTQNPHLTTAAGLPLPWSVRQLPSATGDLASSVMDNIDESMSPGNRTTRIMNSLPLPPSSSRSLFLLRGHPYQRIMGSARLPRLYLMSNVQQPVQQTTNPDFVTPHLQHRPPPSVTADHTESDGSVDLNFSDELMLMPPPFMSAGEPLDTLQPPANHISTEYVEPAADDEEDEDEEDFEVEDGEVTGAAITPSPFDVWPTWPPSGHCPIPGIQGCSGSSVRNCLMSLVQLSTSLLSHRRLDLSRSSEALSNTGLSISEFRNGEITASSRHQLSQSDCELTRLTRSHRPLGLISPLRGASAENSIPRIEAMFKPKSSLVGQLFNQLECSGSHPSISRDNCSAVASSDAPCISTPSNSCVLFSSNGRSQMTVCDSGTAVALPATNGLVECLCGTPGTEQHGKPHQQPALQQNRHTSPAANGFLHNNEVAAAFSLTASSTQGLLAVSTDDHQSAIDLVPSSSAAGLSGNSYVCAAGDVPDVQLRELPPCSPVGELLPPATVPADVEPQDFRSDGEGEEEEEERSVVTGQPAPSSHQ